MGECLSGRAHTHPCARDLGDTLSAKGIKCIIVPSIPACISTWSESFRSESLSYCLLNVVDTPEVIRAPCKGSRNSVLRTRASGLAQGAVSVFLQLQELWGTLVPEHPSGGGWVEKETRS